MTDASYKLLDGKRLAGQVLDGVRRETERLRSTRGRPPGLAVILVGDNPASQAYVASKEKAARERCGFETFNLRLAENVPAQEIAAAIESLNRRREVDGILLQLPLPKGLCAEPLIELISPDKDADGLHPFNQGRLLRGGAELRPCTPAGVMKLIDLAYADGDENADPAPADLGGRTAIVIGRSILVGKPAAFLLLERNATVVLAHSKTADLAGCCRAADIVVAAVGVPHLVQGDWIKPGAVIIDVGMNRLSSGRLTGDVDFAAAAPRCAAITPVPGGVGPMTVAMLMVNTLRAYQQRKA